MKSVHNRRMLIFALLLLIPGINLSSMTQSRLNQRITEIGIRRSFGCSRGDIMWQVFCENLVLTFVYAFLFCLLMNLLSSGFPAWRASRVAITNALNNH